MKFMGCMGVDNKFDSKTECEAMCINGNAVVKKRGMYQFKVDEN